MKYGQARRPANGLGTKQRAGEGAVIEGRSTDGEIRGLCFGVASLASLLSCPVDSASATEAAAAGGMHAKGEKRGRAGAPVGGGGGEGAKGGRACRTCRSRLRIARQESSHLIPGDRASFPGSCRGAAGEDAGVPGCPRKFFGP